MFDTNFEIGVEDRRKVIKINALGFQRIKYD